MNSLFLKQDQKNINLLQQRFIFYINYSQIGLSHYRKAVGDLLFYDLTDPPSYQNANKWLAEIQKYTEEGIIIMLIGNKYDEFEIDPNSRKVTEAEAGKFCNKEYLLFNEVSAKTGYNVRESFENFIESIKKKNYIAKFIFQKKKEIYQENEKRKKNIEPYQRLSFGEPFGLKLENLEEGNEFNKKKCCC